MQYKNQSVSVSAATVLDKYAAFLCEHIAEHKDTFIIRDGNVECDLGGSFIPTCGEMEVMAGYNKEDPLSEPACIPGEPTVLKLGQPLFFSAPPNCCYYEFIKAGTHISRIFVKLAAMGRVEITLYAAYKETMTVIQRSIHDFGSNFTVWETVPVSLSLLPTNGLLMLCVRSYSSEAAIKEFRWTGLVQESKANFGERIYLIRTYGNKPLVSDFIRTLSSKLAVSHTNLLKRSIFVVYDATGNTIEPPVGPLTENMRIMEFTGPNCGGGGNASLLFSLLLRAQTIPPTAIANLVLIDDDARIDADAIVRLDGFTTAAKQDVISAAVVYKSEEPNRIQEYGGIWGRFFNKNMPAFHTAPECRGRTMFPLLPRSGWDLHKRDLREGMAVPIESDYATFIFISFPWELILKTGAPFPFFLRNDDVEICVRAAACGARTLINPNLYAWHNAVHSPVAEFYAVLHGLILNCAYGWLDMSYALESLTYRVASLARAGNTALLAAYRHALEKFACGPHWMRNPGVFEEYLATRNQLKQLMKECCYEIPMEVVESNKEHIHIFDLLNNHPSLVDKDTIFFFDRYANLYYAQHRERCSELLAACLKYLSLIAENFAELAKSWQKCVRGFDHVAFWNQILDSEKLKLQFSRLALPDIIEKVSSQSDPDYQVLKNLSESLLPPGFTEEGYLSKNPDVRGSGIPAREHWLKYGRYEKRQY